MGLRGNGHRDHVFWRQPDYAPAQPVTMQPTPKGRPGFIDDDDDLPLSICSVCGEAIEVGQGTTDAEQEGGLICPRCARGPLPQADRDGR